MHPGAFADPGLDAITNLVVLHLAVHRSLVTRRPRTVFPTLTFFIRSGVRAEEFLVDGRTRAHRFGSRHAWQVCPKFMLMPQADHPFDRLFNVGRPGRRCWLGRFTAQFQRDHFEIRGLQKLSVWRLPVPR